MTCEVAVANRMGIAVAADSAATFTKYGPSGKVTTYSSGINKIVQMHATEPVALMLYNDATLGDMPWELIVKQFRSSLKESTDPTLPGYVDRLIAFLNAATDLFPDHWRDVATQELYGNALVRLVQALRAEHPAAPTDQAPMADRLAAVASFVADMEQKLDGAVLADGLSQPDFDAALTGHAATLVGEASTALQNWAPDLATVLDASTFLRLAIKLTYKWPWEAFSGAGTGVVLAGYGSAEVLPSFVERTFFGFVGSKIYSTHRKQKAVPRDGVGALIEAFARKGMVETFTQGVSPEAWVQAQEEFRKRGAELVDNAIAAAGQGAVHPTGAAKSQLVEDALTSFKQNWADATLNAHWQPLLNAVSSLPVEQLADLAENLVMLESLKERVTHRTQSVGGPIDVAVITKAEGLVWIKRKHYFRADLNHRYFARLGAQT